MGEAREGWRPIRNAEIMRFRVNFRIAGEKYTGQMTTFVTFRRQPGSGESGGT